jgi:hypothetical protein
MGVSASLSGVMFSFMWRGGCGVARKAAGEEKRHKNMASEFGKEQRGTHDLSSSEFGKKTEHISLVFEHFRRRERTIPIFDIRFGA